MARTGQHLTVIVRIPPSGKASHPYDILAALKIADLEYLEDVRWDRK
jgi:hypothetical protein